MNTKITTIAIASLVATGIVAAHPANAQEAQNRGARFDFAPSVWKKEMGPTIPHISDGPAHSVKMGGVPQGSSFLGLDKQDLAKPAPVATTQVAIRPVSPPTAFQNAFGKPVSPVVASMPPQAQVAIARHLPAHKSSVLANKSVNGKLLSPHKVVGQSAGPALAAKSIDSYPKNVGYIPGTYVPSMSDSGMNSRSDVHGVLINH
jgi:hypothetical protein